MENIPDGPIVRDMLNTGYPRWCGEEEDDYG